MTNEVRSRKSEVLVNVQHTGDSVTYSTCSPPAPVATKYHTVTGWAPIILLTRLLKHWNIILLETLSEKWPWSIFWWITLTYIFLKIMNWMRDLTLRKSIELYSPPPAWLRRHLVPPPARRGACHPPYSYLLSAAESTGQGGGYKAKSSVSKSIFWNYYYLFYTFIY